LPSIPTADIAREAKNREAAKRRDADTETNVRERHFRSLPLISREAKQGSREAAEECSPRRKPWVFKTRRRAAKRRKNDTLQFD